MHSIRAKISLLTVIAIVSTMIASAVLGVVVIRDIGTNSSNESLFLLCEVGEKNLDAYFEGVEHSVGMVSSYAESELKGLSDEQLHEHLERVSQVFKRMADETDGILTYYYRIDPSVSANEKGFWFVNLDGNGFKEHEVTDITLYDTQDTSQLVWFTVPKATGQPMWLPPYITDNLDARVISYNVPIYYKDSFVGVVGIEIDYSTMADQVDNITLYDNGYAFINDQEGNIIYHPHMDVVDLVGDNKPKVPEGLLSDDTYICYTYDGVEKQAVWLPLSNGMRLNVTVPVSEINASWHRWIVATVVIFGILLVVFTVLIVRFTGHITKPLKELTEVAEQVNKGNYDVKLDYAENDEVGILTSAFNRLVAHLKIYISDLNDLAYADALTSVHNKGAFDIFKKNLQAELKETGGDKEFAVCIFDCNGLKAINDQYGHDKGNVYLKTASALICEVFGHSPVFRVGGDEFVAVLQKGDFAKRDELVRLFDEKCVDKRRKSQHPWERVDIARGLAVYDSDHDGTVDDTVRRADKLMYEDKWRRKGEAGDPREKALGEKRP